MHLLLGFRGGWDYLHRFLADVNLVNFTHSRWIEISQGALMAHTKMKWK